MKSIDINPEKLNQIKLIKDKILLTFHLKISMLEKFVTLVGREENVLRLRNQDTLQVIQWHVVKM